MDRQLEPNEGIMLYQGRPICDACLSPIMSNMSETQLIEAEGDPSSLESRKKKALEILDKCEELYKDWPLTEKEVLASRDDFFNHRPPAVINLTIEQTKELISYRKAILYAYKIKDEPWTTLIDQIRVEERKAAGIQGIAKSVSEKSKKPNHRFSKAKQEKLLKSLNISPEQLELLGKEARIEEFGDILANKKPKEIQIDLKKEGTQVIKNALAEVQGKLNVDLTPKKISRCNVCGKLTCMCLKG